MQKLDTGMTLSELKQLPKERQQEIIKKIQKLRKPAKTVTYSALYGVGVKKLARESRTTEAEAKVLLDAFWKLNHAVQKVADKAEVRTIGKEKWIKNPVSGFWYSLRNERDRFSTLNQGLGAFCFDTWMAYYTTKRPNVVGQFHDESINMVPEGEQQEHKEVLEWACRKLNEKLKLNVELKVDVKFGKSYDLVH